MGLERSKLCNPNCRVCIFSNYGLPLSHSCIKLNPNPRNRVSRNKIYASVLIAWVSLQDPDSKKEMVWLVAIRLFFYIFLGEQKKMKSGDQI